MSENNPFRVLLSRYRYHNPKEKGCIMRYFLQINSYVDEDNVGLLRHYLSSVCSRNFEELKVKRRL